MTDFRTQRNLLFDSLCEHPYGLTVRKLALILYPGDESANHIQSVRVLISRFNYKLAAFNSPFRIKRTTLGRYALWVRRVRK